MNLSLQTIIGKLTPVLHLLRRYLVLICIAGFVMLYAFLIFQINQAVQVEPTDDAVAAELQGAKRPKIDQSVIDKINQLQDQNVQVQSLFKQARDNPFTE